MLAAKRLPEVIRSILTDGVEGAVIITIEGSILASEFLSYPGGSTDETSFAAICSSIWSNYIQGAHIIWNVIFSF